MKLKIDEAGHAVVVDGKPIYQSDDGKDIVFDVVGTTQTIGRLNAEAKAHRERAESAEKSLKAFDGIDDAELARKAIDTVKNLDHKKLIDAGEVEKVKAETAKVYQTKLDDAEKQRAALESQLYDEKIGGSFARSKMVSEKLAIPADMVQARFGSAFKIEDGKAVAYDHAGNKIYSRARPGEVADFDEALDVLIENYPHKDHILRSSGASGSGGHNSGASHKMNPNMAGMSPTERMTAVRAAAGAKK